MVFAVSVFKGKQQARIGAQIALQHRLFVSGWWLNSRLHLLVRGKHRYGDCVVAIGYLDGVPITVATIEKTMMAFVRKAHRKHGYGKQTVQAAIDASSIMPVAERGVKGSFEFWQKANIVTKGKPV